MASIPDNEHSEHMTSPRLNLLVLRSLDPGRAKAFFGLLGIHFQEEQHGKGPMHWTAVVAGLILEIYPAKRGEEVDARTRIGFEVDDLSAILQRLRAFSVEIVSDVRQSAWGLRAVVRDPDGRSVELLQQ